MADTPAAAPASTTPPPASSAPAAEPSLADLGKLIKFAPAKPAAAKPAPRPAPAAPANVDENPELENLVDDPTAPESAAAPAGAEPAAAEPAPTPAAATEDPTTPEAAPEAAPAPEGLDDEDLATRKAFTPEQQKRFDKALFKQREKARQEKEALEAELTVAKATPPAPALPTADNPLADVATEADLDKRLAEVRNLRRWALTHPNGGTVKDGDKDVEITAEKAAEIVADTEELLDQHGPKRREFIRQNQAFEQQALQDYPWLKSRSSQGTVAVEAMLRQYGDVRLRDIPGIKGSLADLFVGQIIRAQSKQKAAAPAAGSAALPKAPATPAGHRPPPKVSGVKKQAAGASKTLETTGADPGNATLRQLIGRS
jgi:hypothetical protein